MLKKLFLLLLPLSVAATATAQTNFRPGYVLSATGDTLRGAVLTRGDALNSRQIQFQPANGPEKLLLPTEIGGYGTTGRLTYQTFTILDDAGDPLVLTPYFLEVLARGSAMLYRVTTRRGTPRYFARVAGGQLQELVNTTRFTKNAQGAEFGSENREYQQLLAEAFGSCPAAQAAIPKTLFRERALVDLFGSYNAQCGGGLMAQPAPPAGARLQLEALLGGYRGQLSLEGDVPYREASFSQLMPTAGLAIAISSGRTPNLAVRLEAYYSHENYEGRYSPAFRPNQEIQATIDYLRVPLLLRYSVLRTGAWQPFVQAGFVAGIALSFQSAYRTPLNGVFIGGPLIPDDNLRRVDSGLHLGAGFVTQALGSHPLSLTLRYDRHSGFIEAQGVRAPIRRVGLTVGYGLFSSKSDR